MESFAEIVPQVVLRIFTPLLCFSLAAWVVLQLPSVKSRKWSKHGKSAFVGLVSLAIVCTALSDKNTNGVNGVGGMYLMQFNPPVIQSVTPEDISNGWRVAEVSDAGAFAPPPANAVTNERWRLRGAHDDAFRIPADSWSYPFASGVTVLSRGEIRRDIRSCDFPRAFEQDLSQMPVSRRPLLPEGRRESVFWYGATPSNTLLVTWWDFALGRCAANPVRFQSELFPNGGFDYRYEDRTVRHVRVWPFDLDDDGLENSVDPDPLVAGADAHGTNAEWYTVVCSNVLEAVAGDGALGDRALPDLSWLAGVNSNAYYFVDVVATNGPAPIYFTGDRESSLGNPVVVALGGKTNHVPLLIGINYAVTSPVPISISLPDDGFAAITTNSVSNYEVRWPLNFVFTESIGESNRVYSVTIKPFDPGGELTWAGVGGGMRSGTSSGDGCDCINYGFLSVWYTCSKDCTCGRTCRANGIYGLEGAAYPVEGGECRCGFDDAIGESAPEHGYAPCVSATFSRPAVIFEDDYLESLGVTKPGGSTRVRLTLYAYGGPNGGTVSFSRANFGKLTSVGTGAYFPSSLPLAPEETFYSTGVYEGVAASASEGDVSVSGTFTESMAAPPLVSSNSLTVVQVALQTEFTARDNLCNSRHTYGVGEKVHLTATPALSAIMYRVLKADVTDMATPYDTVRDGNISGMITEVDASQSRLYICPATSTTPDLTVSFADVEYRPVMTIVEPSVVVSPAAFASGTFEIGQVGFGCLSITNYIGPFHVSFQGVKVAEIPCDEAIPPTGYFASPYFTGELTHTSNAGAGGLLAFKQDNYWRRDEAGRDGIINNWSPGVLVWKVPIGWKRLRYLGDSLIFADKPDYEFHTNTNSRPLLIGGRVDAYTQTFRIEADGTAVIEKFGWRLIRHPNNASGTVEKIE